MTTSCPLGGCPASRDLAAEVERLTRERDEARAEVERLRAGIEALAESFEEDVDWSSGRGDYGDNAAYEACARRARALLNPSEGEN